MPNLGINSYLPVTEKSCVFHFVFLIYVQDLVTSLEQKNDETEKKFEESNKLSEERLKQANEAEALILDMKMNIQRLSNLF